MQLHASATLHFHRLERYQVNLIEMFWTPNTNFIAAYAIRKG